MGKIANVLVTDGDLFDEKTTIKHVFVEGRAVNLDVAPRPVVGSKKGHEDTKARRLSGFLILLTSCLRAFVAGFSLNRARYLACAAAQRISLNGMSRIGYCCQSLKLKCHHSFGSTVKSWRSITARSKSRRPRASGGPPR